MLNLKLLVFIPLVLLVGCIVTGPADDGYDNQNEWVDNGRLLDDDSKTIYSSDGGGLLSKSAPEDSSEGEMEVSSYQQWLEAKKTNSAAYQRFLQWQEFEEFQQWKLQQKESSK